MKKIIILFVLIILYSCGTESPSSPTINYSIYDQNFIDDLMGLNELSLDDLSEERLISDIVDSSGVSYYKIVTLHLNDMGIDSLPSSIGDLNNLNVLDINGNNLEYLPESICNIYNNLDSIDVSNNDICTPIVPDCIINSTTNTAFYENQQCNIIPDEEDLAFIESMYVYNWQDNSSVPKDSILSILNNQTTWETFTENNNLVSRITEIRYDGQNISLIPTELEVLDSLQRLELQNNQISEVPNIIGYLDRLEYITLQNNQITSIPPLIGQLKKLKVFKIYKNKLTEVHENIGELVNLISFNLSENQITNLPESMCNLLLISDIQISIDHNQICSDYPDCFSTLVSNSVQPECE